MPEKEQIITLYCVTNEKLGLILQRFGNEVRRARHATGLTQEKLAERCGMDITNLQRIESGRYNTKLISLIRLRESLDVDWDDLLP